MEEDIKYWLGVLKADNFNKSFIELVENLIARNKDLENDNINLNDKLQMTKNSIKIANLDIMEDYIPKSKAEELLGKLDKEEKQELKGVKGQDRYFIKQIYQAKRRTIEELLQEGDK